MKAGRDDGGGKGLGLKGWVRLRSGGGRVVEGERFNFRERKALGSFRRCASMLGLDGFMALDRKGLSLLLVGEGSRVAEE